MKTKSLLLVGILVFIALGLLLTGYLIRSNRSSTAQVEITPTSMPPFEGDWKLISLNGHGIIPGSPITLNIRDNKKYSVYGFSGISGCNDYSLIYEIENYRITEANVPGLSSVVGQAGCPVPEGTMEQEKEYLNALYYSPFFQVTENTLEFMDGAGKVTLVFQRP